MGLLDTSCRRGALTGSLGSKLLSWGLTTSGFTYGLLVMIIKEWNAVVVIRWSGVRGSRRVEGWRSVAQSQREHCDRRDDEILIEREGNESDEDNNLRAVCLVRAIVDTSNG